MNFKRKIKKVLFMLLDVLIVCVSAIIAFKLCGKSVFDYGFKVWIFIFACAIVLVGLNSILHLYRSSLKYAGVIELLKISGVMVIITIICLIGIIVFNYEAYYSVVLVYSMIVFLALGLTRCLYRLIVYIGVHGFNFSGIDNATKVMVIGAGDAGSMLIREMITSKNITKRPVCIIDDNPVKHNLQIYGVSVVGTRDDIISACMEYHVDEIIMAMPGVDAKQKSEILNICKETGCKVTLLPGIFQFVEGSVSVSALKEVEISDLLGREQVKVNLDEIMGYIEDRVVLVTGGGGSIGSELCRQIASHNPKLLIILDIYENNAYEIEQELKRKLPNLNLLTLIASIRDKGKVEDVFNKYKPEIVFNAAAHKHVPLMETSPNEAIKNNVFGTLNIAKACDKYGVKRLVQISTDKAVNPTNVMGASKRICEMIIQTVGKKSKTCEMVAVRFGNVLGSNGSVIPLFKKQIAEGGPVTVTHKDITRYFMTIPEAVSLVLQAGAYAKGGEIYVLDMGEPVRIYDLANNLIRLSGHVPNGDIKIEVTGLRPGEKLYEERLMDEEGLEKTANGMISVAKPIELDEENLFKNLDELYVKAYEETDEMKYLVKKLVPTYRIDERK